MWLPIHAGIEVKGIPGLNVLTAGRWNPEGTPKWDDYIPDGNNV